MQEGDDVEDEESADAQFYFSFIKFIVDIICFNLILVEKTSDII